MAEGAPTAFATVFGVFVFGVLLGLPALRLVSLYLDRQIGGFELALSLALLCSFAIGIFALWYSPLKWLLAFMLAIVCVLVLLLGRQGQRKAAERLRDGDYQKCYRLLESDPRNVAAHSRLGDLFFEQGLLDEAITCYQNAVGLAPMDAQERTKLQRAIQAKQRLATEGTDCPRCGSRNVPGTVVCTRCRLPLSARHEFLDALWNKDTLHYAQFGALACLGVVVIALVVQLATGAAPLTLVIVAFSLLFLTALLFFATRLANR